MRCGICPVTFCQYRRTDGDCCLPWGKDFESDVFTAPDTRPWEGVNRQGITIDTKRLPPKERGLNDEQVKMMEAIVFLTTHGWTCIMPDGIDVVALKSAAQDLVDAVEKYTRQECLRSELINKKNKLKELL